MISPIPESGGVVDSSSSSEPQTPPTPYKYPTPQFIEENITVMVELSGNNSIIEWIKEHPWVCTCTWSSEIVLSFSLALTRWIACNIKSIYVVIASIVIISNETRWKWRTIKLYLYKVTRLVYSSRHRPGGWWNGLYRDQLGTVYCSCR